MIRTKGTAKVYRIVVRSELSERYGCAFDGMHMETEEGLTILTGQVKDQSHLHGILNGLCGLGLELLSVEVMPDARLSTQEDRILSDRPGA
jgi:hypothetical protein